MVLCVTLAGMRVLKVQRPSSGSAKGVQSSSVQCTGRTFTTTSTSRSRILCLTPAQASHQHGVSASAAWRDLQHGVSPSAVATRAQGALAARALLMARLLGLTQAQSACFARNFLCRSCLRAGFIPRLFSVTPCAGPPLSMRKTCNLDT